MNLEDILKQFRLIEPDAAYKDHSKRAVLASAEAEAARWSARRTLLQIVETGVAVALAGFFIFLITGGFAGSGLSPVQYAAMDPAGIRAEAQAIDIQIELANLNYAPAAESTPPVAGKPAASAPSLAPSAANATTTSATATSTLSIDEALQKLSN